MKTTTLALVGICGTAFVGYCIYFDKKRRSHPDFLKNLAEKRRKEKTVKENAGKVIFPDLRDTQAVQKFFLEQVQKGEELMAAGQIEEGVDHLTNAVAVCGQPQQLLQVLQGTLPPEVFQMLLAQLPTIQARIATSPTIAASRVTAPSGIVTELPPPAEPSTPAKITEVDDTPSIKKVEEKKEVTAPAQTEEQNTILDVDELE